MAVVAVVGTAGRDTYNVYTKELYDKMVAVVKHMIKDLTNVTLISGGAAWADHIAVKLYLEGYVSRLILHLPCEFIDNQYMDNGKSAWFDNPGRTSNTYHRKFSRIVGINSLTEITEAIKKGAQINVHKGFHARNLLVAKCDHMIALTWHIGSEPSDGGTAHTWKNCQSTSKYHVSLSTL